MNGFVIPSVFVIGWVAGVLTVDRVRAFFGAAKEADELKAPTVVNLKPRVR